MNPDNPMPKATHENPKLPSAPPAGSEFRSSAFFMADVMETVEYVLDQAAQYHDKGNFVRAMIVNLKQWKNWKE